MSIFADKKRSEQLTADIDMRMWELVLDVLNYPELNQEQILTYMRASYGKGYSDALIEIEQDQKGQLLRDHYLKPASI